jgi:hypothetical protein
MAGCDNPVSNGAALHIVRIGMDSETACETYGVSLPLLRMRLEVAALTSGRDGPTFDEGRILLRRRRDRRRDDLAGFFTLPDLELGF